ncbi:hypothetical protein, partial [Serratia marcescens]|uniref:hypothetical protein n=1 Tax=Serratia marcescens TaxID=615 RepID=UPI001952AE07
AERAHRDLADELAEQDQTEAGDHDRGSRDASTYQVGATEACQCAGLHIVASLRAKRSNP